MQAHLAWIVAPLLLVVGRSVCAQPLPPGSSMPPPTASMAQAGTAVWQVPVSLLVRYVYGETPNPMPVWLQTVNLAGSFLVNVIMGPLMTIGLSLVYYDERVRKEGFDLEHMLQQLEASRLNTSGIA